MKEIKKLCEEYLRYKYEYYILGKPSISDVEFDKFEQNLKDTNDKLAIEVTNLVDFPEVGLILKLGLDIENIIDLKSKKNTFRKDRFKHEIPMLSLEKIQINDIENIPVSKIQNFFNRIKTDYVECTAKYDGNSMSLTYIDGKLKIAKTRGDGIAGLDKTDRIKDLVPNTIPDGGVYIVRGEVIIDEKTFEKYRTPGKIENGRNFLAGKIGEDDFDEKLFKDVTFVAYTLIKIENKPIHVENSMNKLLEFGFNTKHEPFVLEMEPDIDNFVEVYKKFVEYRKSCGYALDGFVIKFKESLRSKLGETSHHTKSAIAIKFESEEVETTINDIIWEMGKLGDLTPIAILEPIILLDTVVQKCSLHNIGYIVKNGTTPGAVVRIRKAGEIIPQIIEVIKPSPYHEEYLEQFNDFLNSSSVK